MKYRTLGNTDLQISTVSFGCWAIIGGFNWGHQEKKDSLDALCAAYDSGINFFDTAEAYGNGYSEQLIAEALGKKRDRIIIASKASPPHFTSDKLRTACERSLKNLRTGYIDLYQLHWPNWEIPIQETLGSLEQLKQEGKIRAYGVSNYGPQDLKECLQTKFEISSNQMAYSLLFRAVEYEVLSLCQDNHISLLCYSPIMQGLLTGKFNSIEEIPEDRQRTRHFSSSRPEARHNEEGAEAETMEAVSRIRKIAKDAGISMTSLSIAWLLSQPSVATAIVGGRSADQAKKNALAADVELETETLSRLSQATEQLKQKMGRNLDMWETESRIQ
ncbi:MAG: aldo/keto reductase [Candidatus Aminicenantes bacterium]|nr:aldo/keto reductase [Candidatus Aminicenantes bacterium]